MKHWFNVGYQRQLSKHNNCQIGLVCYVMHTNKKKEKIYISIAKLP
jgi:hypothetical protein